MRQIVNFPTRGNNILDLILTNMKFFYDSPIKSPPFGLSDHVTVEVQPRALKRPKNSGTKAVVMSSDLRPSKRLAFGKYIEKVNVKY